MSLLTLVQDAAAELKQVSNFSSVVGNNNTSVRFLLSLANAEVLDCRRAYKWPQLTKTGSVTLVAAQQKYALPADFQAFAPLTWWDTSKSIPAFGPLSAEEFSAATYSMGALPVDTYYRVEGYGTNQLLIYPTPGSSDAGKVLAFRYLSKTCVLPAAWEASKVYAAGAKVVANDVILYASGSGTTGSTLPYPASVSAESTINDGGAPGIDWYYRFNYQLYERFQNDTDTSVFGDELTKLGVKWRWLRENRFDYESHLAEYMAARSSLFASFKGEPRFRVGESTGFRFVDETNIPSTGIGS